MNKLECLQFVQGRGKGADHRAYFPWLLCLKEKGCRFLSSFSFSFLSSSVKVKQLSNETGSNETDNTMSFTFFNQVREYLEEKQTE